LLDNHFFNDWFLLFQKAIKKIEQTNPLYLNVIMNLYMHDFMEYIKSGKNYEIIFWNQVLKFYCYKIPKLDIQIFVKTNYTSTTLEDLHQKSKTEIFLKLFKKGIFNRFFFIFDEIFFDNKVSMKKKGMILDYLQEQNVLEERILQNFLEYIRMYNENKIFEKISNILIKNKNFLINNFPINLTFLLFERSITMKGTNFQPWLVQNDFLDHVFDRVLPSTSNAPLYFLYHQARYSNTSFNKKIIFLLFQGPSRHLSLGDACYNIAIVFGVITLCLLDFDSNIMLGLSFFLFSYFFFMKRIHNPELLQFVFFTIPELLKKSE